MYMRIVQMLKREFKKDLTWKKEGKNLSSRRGI